MEAQIDEVCHRLQDCKITILQDYNLVFIGDLNYVNVDFFTTCGTLAGTIVKRL